MRKTPRTAKAKALLRAERIRAAKKAQGEPQQGNLWGNPSPKPFSSKSGPKGAPLYNADQKEMVKDPKHKKVSKAPGVPGVKKPAGQPSPSPLYDANQTDLTPPKAFSGKRQERLKGAKMGVIARIRRTAAAPSSDMIDMRAQKDLDNVVNTFVKKLKTELKELKKSGVDTANIRAVLKKRYPFINESLFKKMGL